ncbi:hypothetical protein D9615_010626 [Tricholomella constricta]|uniref:Uncharacterized protein n=1 Tax=Tricholomella constricta TaxID=117010 RepID=A0A8H5LRG1_9AGAR|nr:hypothetical protein D9615_010626 [Tricholomella constricta]
MQSTTPPPPPPSPSFTAPLACSTPTPASVFSSHSTTCYATTQSRPRRSHRSATMPVSQGWAAIPMLSSTPLVPPPPCQPTTTNEAAEEDDQIPNLHWRRISSHSIVWCVDGLSCGAPACASVHPIPSHHPLAKPGVYLWYTFRLF